MTGLNPKKDGATLADFRQRYPIGSEVDVDGKIGTVSGYGLHSRTLIVMVGGERLKLPVPKQKKA